VFISPRQQKILKAIIEDYVFTAEPVGSRALSKKFDFGLSPATLRNEMADLEEEGLLRQPHTSAGRIPSDAGYRVFVDGLMEPARHLPQEELRVLDQFQLDARDLNDILAQTAKVAAVLSQCTAIVRAPRLHTSRIQYVQLLPLGERSAMLLILTDQGSTLNQLVTLPSAAGEDELAPMTNFLNAHLRGQPLDALTGQVLERLLAEMAAYEQVIRAIWQKLQAATGPTERVFVSNASFLAQQPEFTDAGKMRSLLCFLEREQTMANLLSLLSVGEGYGARISIGHENPLADLHECSVVSATYSIGDRVCGEIAVLGPTRLEYGRAVLAVETMARSLSQTLTNFFGFRAPSRGA
jgi:heat-inducible transcriptional repressor